ncbi:uncharacterized protein [Rutidosis leptorrhynchoides]|uniref:uncharacterized protein n=1 Tax=Rutidosis leptorrhynchoides TaxID=125765 RepID=UPI003A990EE5
MRGVNWQVKRRKRPSKKRRPRENEIYKISRRRESSKDINGIRCIKDEENKVLVSDVDIKLRWRNYFDKLFNGVRGEKIVEPPVDEGGRICYIRRIRFLEVKEALRKMKNEKACGSDDISIEVWKCLGDIGIAWLKDYLTR